MTPVSDKIQKKLVENVDMNNVNRCYKEKKKKSNLIINHKYCLVGTRVEAYVLASVLALFPSFSILEAEVQ